MINVLYIHSSGPFGGSSRSIYEMSRRLSKFGDFNLFFLTQKGTAAKYFSELGKVFSVRGVSQFDHGQYSWYRGFRWLVLARELFYLPFTVVGLLRVYLSVSRVDVVHGNDFVVIFPLALAKFIFGAKAVLHVRCVVNSDASLWRTKFLHWLLAKVPDKIICIDKTVRASLPAWLDCEVVHNGFTLSSVGLRGSPELRSSSLPLRIGFVGNILRQKGIFELVYAAKQLVNDGRTVEFHIFGGASKEFGSVLSKVLLFLGLRENVTEEIIRKISDLGLGNHFIFHGFVNDLEKIYTSIDVICFPSHLNAPGRPVFEAAYFFKPSIVGVLLPTDDTLLNYKTGIAVRPGDVLEIALAISYFDDAREEVFRMGLEAGLLFDALYNQDDNSERVSLMYSNMMGE